MIHAGHIELLKFAKKQGDELIVGIDSDRRVKEMKGETRPINSQILRKSVLEAIKYVDSVVVFDTKDEMEFLLLDQEIDVIIIGDDYMDKEVTGSQICEVMFFPRIPNLSTSSLVFKTTQQRDI